MVLVVAHDHPLVDADEVGMRALAQEEWILRADDHPVLEVMRRASRRAGFEPKVAFYANDYAEAQAMVSVGLGVALIPRTAMANQHPNVRMISLGKTVPETPHPRRIPPSASPRSRRTSLRRSAGQPQGDA